MFYRKYRPQTWEELATKHIRETLGKAIMDNKWSHAYLLIGSRGTGKTTTARLIAKTVNCTGRKKGEEPCNQCDSCLAIIGASSLDVIEIDAASNTGVDDIRDLREKVKLSPTASKYKVYIIDEVHMLSTSAFNALLKTLEEPPEHVIFILATTDPQKLPETITSRCLVYNFGLADKIEIKTRLQKIAVEEKLEVSEEVIMLISEKANGSHRDAQKIFEQLTVSGAKVDMERLNGLNFDSAAAYSQTIIKSLGEVNREAALNQIEKYVQSGGKIKELISRLVLDLRDMLISGEGDVNPGDIVDLIKNLIEANVLVADSPVPQLPLELLVVEWCQKLKGKEAQDKKEIFIPSEEKETAMVVTEQPAKSGKSSSSVSGSDFKVVLEKWLEIVAATKPFNHSLNAFLKAAKPARFDEDYLIVSVNYKFHKEKLEEKKNRDILEQVISDIIGQEVKVRFELGTKSESA